VKTTARNAATASCHHELPTITKTVHPAASAAAVAAIFQA
jgi:hypothetical protein